MAKQKAQSKSSWKGSGDMSVTGDFKILEEKFGAIYLWVTKKLGGLD